LYIAFIIPYFGKLPWYFPWFLHSCNYNPDIHFFIITNDTGYSEPVPGNVFLIHKTFEETRQLIEEKLQMETTIPHPYKLCDFRPAYGIIFSELVTGYDFWGHADIDVIFGNIRSFITDEILTTYDVVSVRPEYISGFFALYRNTARINSLFELSKDYKEVFKDGNNLDFDECGMLCDSLAEGATLAELPVIVESMTHVVDRLDRAGEIKVYFNFHAIESTPGNLKWDCGQLFYKNEFEVLLYHLVSFKVHPQLEIPVWEKIPSSFYINEYSFST
jgi:hypothetical protein